MFLFYFYLIHIYLLLVNYGYKLVAYFCYTGIFHGTEMHVQYFSIRVYSVRHMILITDLHAFHIFINEQTNQKIVLPG